MWVAFHFFQWFLLQFSVSDFYLVQFAFFHLLRVLLVLYLKSLCLTQGHKNLLLFLLRVKSLTLAFRSVIHLEFIFYSNLFFLSYYLFIYVFLAALCLRCWTWAFSSYGPQGLLSSCSVLTYCHGFFCCGAQALELTGFSSCGAWA